MMILADYVLTSDLCLPAGSPVVEVTGPDWNLAVSNIGNPADESAAKLAGRLTFEHSGDLTSAEDAADEKLALALNALVYTTNRKFACTDLLKIVDWTPGIVEREARIFHSSPFDDRSEPALGVEFTGTATHIAALVSGEKQVSAMRWYRLGISEANPEQQFAYFWLALEVAAQALKPTEKRNNECPICHGKLYCETCQNHPMHLPYPGEAIKSLLERVHAQNAQEIFSVLQKIRHALMHGRGIKSIAPRLPCTYEQAIEKLARITWQAITLMFVKDTDPTKRLFFGAPPSVVRRSLVAGIHVRTNLLRDHDNPRVENFPDFKLSMELVPRGTGPDKESEGAGDEVAQEP